MSTGLSLGRIYLMFDQEVRLFPSEIILSDVDAVIVEVVAPSAGIDTKLVDKDIELQVGASPPTQSLSIRSSSHAGSVIGVYSLLGV